MTAETAPVDQSMGEATFEEICRRAWESVQGFEKWADVSIGQRGSFSTDIRNALTAAADLMPIETLHGADGASMWLRGEQ